MKRTLSIALVLAAWLPQLAVGQVRERVETPKKETTTETKPGKRKKRAKAAKTPQVPRFDSPQKITTVLKSNPFSILWGPIPFTAEYKLGYEITTSSKQSSQLSFSYLGKSPLFSVVESSFSAQQGQDINFVFRGFRFQGSQRFWAHGFAENFGLGGYDFAPEGLYFAPHISYSTVTISNQFLNVYDVYLRGSHFNINLHMGYQLSLGDHLMVEAFAGLGYKRNWWVERLPAAGVRGVDTEEFGALYNSPMRFSVGYTIGWGF